MYKITLPINLDGYRYGIKFFKGVGETDDERIAKVLVEKGFIVEPDPNITHKASRSRRTEQEDE